MQQQQLLQGLQADVQSDVQNNNNNTMAFEASGNQQHSSIPAYKLLLDANTNVL
jgi:hypothetical protein